MLIAHQRNQRVPKYYKYFWLKYFWL